MRSNVLFKYGLQTPFGAGYLAGNTRISLAGKVNGLGKRLKNHFHDMVRLIAVKEFDVQVAAGFIDETLEKLTGKPEAERAGHVLRSFRLGNRPL